MRKHLLLILASSFSTSVFATDFSFDVSEHIVATEIDTHLNPNAKIGGGYIYTDNNGHMAQFSMHMTHTSGPHSIEIGPKFSRVWFDNYPSGSVIAIGGNYQLQLNPNLGLHVGAYYAPSVLSFADVDGYQEFEAKMQYNFSPNMGVYIGHRSQRFKYDDYNNKHFTNGFMVGGTATF